MLSGRRYCGGGGRALVFVPLPLDVSVILAVLFDCHTWVSSHDRARRLRRSHSWLRCVVGRNDEIGVEDTGEVIT